MDFSKARVQIQLWGLPIHYQTEKMGMEFGSSLGHVLDSTVDENRERGTFVKILTKIDIKQPLKARTNVGSKRMELPRLASNTREIAPVLLFMWLGHDEDYCPNGKLHGLKDYY
ncbi:cysteine desulfurase mitochondrial-like [Sesbania bispinosa]|nr:cysteine desulfurase mitochondrial-like [Sesbania bispinosa]